MRCHETNQSCCKGLAFMFAESHVTFAARNHSKSHKVWPLPSRKGASLDARPGLSSFSLVFTKHVLTVHSFNVGMPVSFCSIWNTDTVLPNSFAGRCRVRASTSKLIEPLLFWTPRIYCPRKVQHQSLGQNAPVAMISLKMPHQQLVVGPHQIGQTSAISL